MRGRLTSGLLVLVACALVLTAAAWAAPPVPSVPGERELLTLRNGLEVLLCRDTVASAVDVAVWYEAGQRSEPAGKPGLAALAQRLMFTGRGSAPADEHMSRIEAIGGTVGAVVAGDYACYFQTVPESALELALELEASRMGTIPVDAKRLENARWLLQRERRQPAASSPFMTGVAALFRIAFSGHPYGHPPLGDEQEIQKLTLKDVQTWYGAHYGPRRALVTIVGRFEFPIARALVRKHLEAVRAGSTTEPVTPATEADPAGERRAREAVGAPFRVVMLGFRGPGSRDPEVAALTVLSQILSGPKGRLERELKSRLGSAFLTSGDFEVRRDGSLFFCSLGIDAPGDSTRAEAELVSEIERLGREPVGDSELLRAQRQAESRLLFDWYPTRGRATALAVGSLTMGKTYDPSEMVERLRGVSSADVQAAARKWLDGRRRIVVWLVPRASTPAAAPAGGSAR